MDLSKAVLFCTTTVPRGNTTMDYKHLKVTREGPVTIVHLPSDTGDRLKTVQMSEELLSLSDQPPPVLLAVTFDEARWFGSEAIGALIRLVTRVRAKDGDVRLCSMSKNVRQIFEICNLLGTVFKVYDSTAEAVDSYLADSD
jgi:anti-anti-sigma factor